MGGRGKRRSFRVGATVLPLVLSLVPLAITTACRQPESTKLDEQPPAHVRSAEVRIVEPRPQSRHLVLIEPARRARLAPRLGGQLVELLVTEQQEVAEGDLLAKLAAQDSKGSLIAAKASISRINESIRDTNSELSTARELAAKGVESARAVERLETSQATLQAQLREAKGQLIRARDAVGAGTVEAPFAGTITAIETEVGEYLAPSSAAIVLSQLDPLAVEVPLTEREVAQHDVGGLSYSVTIRGEVHDARLEWIAREAKAGTSTFPARLLIENPEGALRAGESAEVEVFGAAGEKQTAVPMTAVRWAADQAYVLLIQRSDQGAGQGADPGEGVTPNATLERVDVTVLDDSDELVVVRGAVAAGDRVVAAGPTRLIGGTAVVVVDDPKPSLAAR